ncbi:unnamed protein product [Closterium sp. NIES-65]|nr:unnamed protein product [Closterium sp. NIES-65]
MGVLAKLLYVLVEDDDGEQQRAGSSSKLAAEAGGKGARAAVRYTKSVLSSTLQLMGCKSRHAVKISERVFQMLLQQVTSRRVSGHRTDVAHRSRMANGFDGTQRLARPNREDSGAVLATSASHDNHSCRDNNGRDNNERTENRAAAGGSSAGGGDTVRGVSVSLKRSTFLDVVCRALAEYRYLSADQRSDLALACNGCGKSTLASLLVCCTPAFSALPSPSLLPSFPPSLPPSSLPLFPSLSASPSPPPILPSRVTAIHPSSPMPLGSTTSLTCSLPHMLPPSHAPSLTCALPHMLPPSHAPSLTCSLPHMLPPSHAARTMGGGSSGEGTSLTCSLPHMLPPSHAPSLTCSLPHMLPPSHAARTMGGGSSGEGASRVGITAASTHSASRLGITRVVSTDSLRHMMRGFSSREANPLLYASTYQAGEHLDPAAVADAKARKKAEKLGGKHGGAQADTQAAAAQRDWEGGRERRLAAGEVGGQVRLREMQGAVDLREMQGAVDLGAGESRGAVGLGGRVGGGQIGGEGNNGGEAAVTGGGGGGRDEREMGEAVWDGRPSVTGLDRERSGEGGSGGKGRDLGSGMDAVNGKEPMSEKEVVSEMEAVSEREGVSEREMVIQGYKAQSEMVIGSVEQLLCKWERCHESAIVEGVHLSLNFVMELLKRHPTIIPFVIYIGNEAKHMERFAVRAKYMTLDPRRNKYVRYMRNIRAIQDYLVRRADKHLIPKVNNTNMDKSVAAIHATVFTCLRHRAAGESMYSRASNTLPLLHHEYDTQYTASGLGSKGMLYVIQREGSLREGSLREGSVRSSASDLPDPLSGLPTRAVSLPTYAFGADSSVSGAAAAAGEPYPPAAAHTRLSPLPPDFPPDGSPHGDPPGTEASQSHGPPSLSTLASRPPCSLRVSEGSTGTTSWGPSLQAGAAHACVYPEELSDGYASGYSSGVPPRGPRDRFAFAASFPAGAQGLPWQAGHGQVPPPPAVAIPLLNLSETPSATEGSLESPSALLSSGVSACSTPRVGAPGAGASLGASGGGGGSVLAPIHVRFSGRTAFPRSADVGNSSGGEGLAERERERRARGGAAAAAGGAVGEVGVMGGMGMGRLAKAMDGVRMSGGGQFAAHMPSFYGSPASCTHALQKKEEVRPLCPVWLHSLLSAICIRARNGIRQCQRVFHIDSSALPRRGKPQVSEHVAASDSDDDEEHMRDAADVSSNAAFSSEGSEHDEEEGSVASDESFSLSEGGTDDDIGEGDSAQPLPHHLSLSAAAVPPGGELNVFLDAASLPHVLPSASYYGTHGNYANHTSLDAQGNYGTVPRDNEPMGHRALGAWGQHYTALQEGAAGYAGGAAPPAAAAGAFAAWSHSLQHTAGRPHPPLHLHRVPSAPGATGAASAASRAGLPPCPTGHSTSSAHFPRRGADPLPPAARAFPPTPGADSAAATAAAATEGTVGIAAAAATAAAGASRAQGGREWGIGRRAGAGAGVVLGKSKSMGGMREREAGVREVGEREAGRMRVRPSRPGAARRFSDTGAASRRGWAALETTLQGGALVLQERESLQPRGIALQQERHMAQQQQQQQQPLQTGRE